MATDDFFRARLDQMSDLRHPLVVLAGRIPWAALETSLAPSLAHGYRKAGGSAAWACSVRRWSWPARG